MEPTPVYLYNPDDEADRHAFNGLHIELAPNQTTDIAPLVEDARAGAPGRWEGLTAEHAAAHILESLGRFGVCRTKGPVAKSPQGGLIYGVDEDEATIFAAEALYDLVTRDWATSLSLGYHRAAKPFLDAGLPLPQPSPQEQKALAWLQTHPVPALQPLSPDPLA